MAKKIVALKPKPKRLGKFEKVVVSTSQEWAHSGSTVINSRRRVLQFEAEEINKSIIGLSAALANARERRALVDAILTGLAAVIEKR